MSENIKDYQIMTVSEVARYFKISEVTCYKLVQNGKITARPENIREAHFE